MVKNSITCISLLFIGCGISYFSLDYYNHIKEMDTNELLVDNYFHNVNTLSVTSNSNNGSNVDKEKENNYVAILTIPKLNFKRGLYEQHSPGSELSKNIIFLDNSDMPNKKNSRVIIVGHSGDTSNAYFKYLYKLKYRDLLYLYFNGVKYTYQVSDIYDIRKNGTLALESNKDKKTLTLVTCKGSHKQLVIISTLTKEEVIG